MKRGEKLYGKASGKVDVGLWKKEHKNTQMNANSLEAKIRQSENLKWKSNTPQQW